MVAADDDGADFATRHHVVEGEAEPVALAEPDPADPCRQALEADAGARHVEPAVQVRVVGDQFPHPGIRAVDVLRIAAQRRPAEGADAAAEQRADIGGHEAWEAEGAGQPFLLRHLPDVVAVIHHLRTTRLEVQHRLDMRDHAALRRRGDGGRVAFPLRSPLRQRPAGREVAVRRVMRAGLVGDDVGDDAAADQLREDLRRVAQQADGDRPLLRARRADHRQRGVEVVGAVVEVAGLQPLLDARRPAFDREHGRAGEDAGQRLRPAHAAEPAGQDPPPAEVAAEMLPAAFDKGLVGALHDPLAADVDPGPRGHLAVHHQAFPIELGEVLPARPAGHQVGIGDQHARRIGMGLEDADRLAGLHQQRLVVAQPAERGDDRLVAFPVARGAADAAIDHEFAGLLRDLVVEVVHQHPQRRLRRPVERGFLEAARGADGGGVAEAVVHAGEDSRRSGDVVPRTRGRQGTKSRST